MKKKNLGRKMFNSRNLNEIEKDISIIKRQFFEREENAAKEQYFNEKYEVFDIEGTYTEILLIMKDYPEFNIFDYINSDLIKFIKEISQLKVQIID